MAKRNEPEETDTDVIDALFEGYALASEMLRTEDECDRLDALAKRMRDKAEALIATVYTARRDLRQGRRA